MNASSSTALWRRLVAGLGPIAGVGWLIHRLGSGDGWKLAVPMVAVVAAAVTIHVSRLGAQLFSRAAWWANLGLGAVLCLLGGSSEHIVGLYLASACGMGLLLVGRRSLYESGERAAYAPPALRGALLLLMVLGLADAQTFLLFAVLQLQGGKLGSDAAGVVLGVASLALFLGFLGLLRLQLWGAVVNMATCAIVLAFSVGEGYGLDHDLWEVIGAFASLQLAVGVPMLGSVLLRRPLPTLPPRVRGVLADGAIVLLLLVCAGNVVLR